MSLYQDFKTNKGKVIHKWEHYFPIYDRYFGPWKNKTLTFLEIGVSKGGSLQMWKRYFGPLATIVGIDINPNCSDHADEDVLVRIGDQSDPIFLQSLLDEFGEFDIVLDDGSHHMDHVMKTFDFLYKHTSKNGIYLIEDMHTAYWEEFGGGFPSEANFVNATKSMIDKLNADHSRGAIESDYITKNTFSIAYYDSVVVFEKGQIPSKRAPVVGKREGRIFKKYG